MVTSTIKIPFAPRYSSRTFATECVTIVTLFKQELMNTSFEIYNILRILNWRINDNLRCSKKI